MAPPIMKHSLLVASKASHCATQRAIHVLTESTSTDLGIKYKCQIVRQEDLNRQLVKSASCTIHFPDWDFTIPPGRGQLTTVEGILRDVVKDLSINQPLRKHTDLPTYEGVQKIIDRLETIVPDYQDPNVDAAIPLAEKFFIEVDDPSGNSFVEFLGSMADPQWHMNQYPRTAEQNVALGLAPDATAPPETQANDGAPPPDDEILVFPGPCPTCTLEVNTLMKKVNIPYFKDIFIMSTNCEACGYKDNEVKSGAAVSDKGKTITLKILDEEDLSRDILKVRSLRTCGELQLTVRTKSETCGFQIPEIELKLEAGTLGGRFTTIEGLLDQIFEELSSKVFSSDDAVDDNNSMRSFLRRLQNVGSSILFRVLGLMSLSELAVEACQGAIPRHPRRPTGQLIPTEPLCTRR